MPRIISIVNQKGGVGKTTTAIHLSAALARAGKFVLLVDLDPQANATSGMGLDHRNLTKGIYEVLVDGVSLKEIILELGQTGLRLAPATVNLAGAAVDLVSMDRREFRLADALLEIKHGYDFIIIDSPPSLGLLTINGLVACQQVLIPVQPEYFALEGVGQLLDTIRLVRENLRPDLELLGAVITMLDKRNRLGREVLAELQKHFPDRLFSTMIPRTVRLAEAPSHGKTIFDYEPTSPAAIAYEALAKEIMEKTNNS
ncbi:MAG TPA: ParA family protein [Patescibacteria group bacterium]|nr:ParA family protein [Patescibacteria group bacterium]